MTVINMCVPVSQACFKKGGALYREELATALKPFGRFLWKNSGIPKMQYFGNCDTIS
jgi:hypothetical protein